jgi:hypothetical protein
MAPFPTPAFHWLAVSAAALLALVSAGCGGSSATYPVAGVVQFEGGAPVPYGTVEFRNRDTGAIARGKLDPRGHFVLGTFSQADGATAGTYKVIVVQQIQPDQKLSPDAVAEHPFEDGHEHDEVEHEHGPTVWLVAPKFASYDLSGLTAEVQPVSSNNVKLVVKGFSPARAGRADRP